MANIRPAVAKAVVENSFDDVVFQDPFTEEARKAKRNLVAASFAALLIAALDLQVSGFLGLQTATGVAIASSITKGLACLLVAYFLAGFCLTAYIDYAAWKFKREKVLISPYLELIKMLESHIHVTGEQVTNATGKLDSIPFRGNSLSEPELSAAVAEAKGQLSSIADHAKSLHEEFKPLLTHWAGTVRKAERLTWRLRARFLSLWLLDLAIPLLLAVAAVWSTQAGLRSVWAKVAA